MSIYKRALTKPDGRRLILYGAKAEPPELPAPSPGMSPAHPATHLRWHPLRGEWVAYASHRQNRTFLPPPEYNPLLPGEDTEVPRGAWDVAVFENLFPTLSRNAKEPPPESLVPTRPGKGTCEVVVFTQDPKASLGQLPLERIELLFEVWADRTRELGARDDVQYVFPFENRGVEIGVTLHHPHGQIYAYPFVPPIPARELSQQKEHLERTGRGLLQEMLDVELRDGQRILWRGEHAAVLVPVCARYTYEIWIAPIRPVQRLYDATFDERRELARALKLALLKLDNLWQRPMPYLLLFHQAPTDGLDHPEAHLHIEILPYLRMPGRLKYLAGSEIGAGAFTADTLPEEKAAELRAVEVKLD
ncbi:MAG: galactose-1-phosphate uridylyltransferase [Myxococcales bacterium]